MSPAVIPTAPRSSPTSSGDRSRKGTSPTSTDVEWALTQVLRSEHNHFSRIWDDATHNERLLLIALAQEPPEPTARTTAAGTTFPPRATFNAPPASW